MMDSGVALVVGTFLLLVPGVSCSTEVSALIAACSVAAIMLIIVIVVIVIGVTWKGWYPQWQRWKGKVKIPSRVRRMRKMRKQMAKRPPVSTSAASTLRRSVIEEKDPASYIQSWSNNSNQMYDGYEEKGKTMQLDEEEEIRIETYVVENETLNLGPFDQNEPKTPYVEDPPTTEFEGTPNDLYASVIKSVKGPDEATLSQGSSGIGGSATLNGEQETQMQTLSFSGNDPAVMVF